ncbi:MAG TPA: MFS transporter [Actinoplanes sp.]|nr:MFS transporter [Actinoplanes sp.]
MEKNRRWWALTAVALGTFMTYLDNNVVNVALPSIQRDLGLSIAGLEWITSAYILVFAGLLLAGGRIADVLGTRLAFVGGLIVFTVASVAAGLADSQAMLIGARALQGVGAALLAPASLALIQRLFPDPKERGAAIGVWGGVGALALAVGPFTGGVLSEHVAWGWIFLINLPIGVATLVLTLASVPADAAADRTGALRRLDPAGLAASSLALSALTYALIEGNVEGWTSPLILTLFGLAAAAATAFVLLQNRNADAMVDLRFFRSRMFTGGLLAMGLWAFGVFGIYFYMALYLQDVLGFTPTEAGAAFIPMAIITAVGAVLAPRFEIRFGVARVTAFGLAVMAAAIGGIARYGADTTYADLLPWFVLYGIGGGLLIPLNTVVVDALPPQRAGIASGMLNVSREVFGLLGVTVLGAILTDRSATAGFLNGYQDALVVAAVLVAAGVPVSLWMLRRPQAGTGADASTEREIRSQTTKPQMTKSA